MLVQLSSEQYLLVLAMHHIITDGWSISILFRELATCYEAFTNGNDPQPPDLPLQYASTLSGSVKYITGNVLAKQVFILERQNWRARKRWLDSSNRPCSPQNHKLRGATEELNLREPCVAALRKNLRNVRRYPVHGVDGRFAGAALALHRPGQQSSSDSNRRPQPGGN